MRNPAHVIRKWTSKDIAQSLRDLGIAELSERTMQHVLQEMYISKTTAVTDVLTARHKEIRLDWCEMMKIALMVKLWLFEDWLISDEVRVSLDGKDAFQIDIIKRELRYVEL